MRKKKTIIAIIVIVALSIIVTAFNNHQTKQRSVEIDKEFLMNDLPLIEVDIKELLYVEKLTDEESVAFALAKNSNDAINLFVIWDGWSRYDNSSVFEFMDINDLSDVGSYQLVDNTKFGQPYYCLFQNPTTDTVTLDGKEHKVFKFNCTLDGEEYYLGFYCDLKK